MLKVNHTFNVNAIKIKYRHRKDRHRCRSFVNFTGYMCTLGKAHEVNVLYGTGGFAKGVP